MCVLAGTAFGGVGTEPHPDLVRQLAREPDGGARPDRPVRRGPRSWLIPRSGRPRVFVARRHPRRGPRRRPRGVRRRPVGGDLPPPRDELLRRVAGCDGVADAAHRPGRRRVPRRRRAAAPGRQQLRRRLRQHRCRGVRAARGPGRQHAGRPDRDDRRPRLGAADGRRASPARGRPVRPRRQLEDMGAAAAARARTSTARRSASSGSGGSARRSRGGRRASGCEILYHDVQRAAAGRRVTALGATYLPLEELLPRADFVSLHVNLSPGDAPPDQRRDAGAG